MKFTVAIQEIEDGWFMGKCEQVPGAMSQGKTIDELMENMKDAITLVLEAERDLCRKQMNGAKVIRRKIAIA